MDAYKPFASYLSGAESPASTGDAGTLAAALRNVAAYIDLLQESVAAEHVDACVAARERLLAPKGTSTDAALRAALAATAPPAPPLFLNSPLYCEHKGEWLTRPLDDTTWCGDCGRWRDDIMRVAALTPPDERLAAEDVIEVRD